MSPPLKHKTPELSMYSNVIKIIVIRITSELLSQTFQHLNHSRMRVDVNLIPAYRVVSIHT